MKNFRTYHLAVQFYHASKELKLAGDARDQLTRASRSIVLNLAEGQGRYHTKDRKRFFRIALASLRESQAILDLELMQGNNIWELADKLGAYLYLLIKKAP